MLTVFTTRLGGIIFSNHNNDTCARSDAEFGEDHKEQFGQGAEDHKEQFGQDHKEQFDAEFGQGDNHIEQEVEVPMELIVDNTKVEMQVGIHSSDDSAVPRCGECLCRWR